MARDTRVWVKRDKYETCQFNSCGLPRDVLVTPPPVKGTLQAQTPQKLPTRMECAKGHYQFP